MFALYYYKAADPAAGVFHDLSCRRDPDFTRLTFGICRPPLRARLFRQTEAVTLLFYTAVPRTSELLATALVTVKAKFATHGDAQEVLSAPAPTNLLVPNNPCQWGTVFIAAMNEVRPRNARCSCRAYIGRSATPFFMFDPETARTAVDEPVRIAFDELKQAAPLFFRRRTNRAGWAGFQQATSNDVHQLESAEEQAAVQSLFLQRLKAESQNLQPSEGGSGRGGLK